MQPRPTAEPILLEAIALVHRLEVYRRRAAEQDVLQPHAWGLHSRSYESDVRTG